MLTPDEVEAAWLNPRGCDVDTVLYIREWRVAERMRANRIRAAEIVLNLSGLNELVLDVAADYTTYELLAFVPVR